MQPVVQQLQMLALHSISHQQNKQLLKSSTVHFSFTDKQVCQ